MKITIPIRGADYPNTASEYDRFLKEIIEFGEKSALKTLLDNEPGYENLDKLEFSLIESPDINEKVDPRINTIKSRHPNFVTEHFYEFLVIDVNFKIDYSENWFIAYYMNAIIERFSLLVNLSFATRIDFLQGVIYNGKKFLSNTSIVVSNLDSAYEHAAKMKWPKLNSVSLDKTINWFIKNNLLLTGNSKNKLHRAINAFSYIFSDLKDKDTSNLFWHMLGIEALLAEGNNDISNQIRTKSSLILGEPKDYKKKLNKLYNYRSRFVHGDIDFPAKFSTDYEVFEAEYWDYLSFATSILLALIRDLIDRQENEFQFEYSMIK